MARVGPLIYLWSIVFLHFEFLFHHQPLPCHQPWESLITQDDNMETIKPTYFSKTASLLSLLWAIKISHSSHRPLKHWTWQVSLGRPLPRPKPFFTQALPTGTSKCCAIIFMVMVLRDYSALVHCLELQTSDQTTLTTPNTYSLRAIHWNTNVHSPYSGLEKIHSPHYKNSLTSLWWTG